MIIVTIVHKFRNEVMLLINHNLLVCHHFLHGLHHWYCRYSYNYWFRTRTYMGCNEEQMLLKWSFLCRRRRYWMVPVPIVCCRAISMISSGSSMIELSKGGPEKESWEIQSWPAFPLLCMCSFSFSPITAWIPDTVQIQYIHIVSTTRVYKYDL